MATILAVSAHPDDETLFCGGTLAYLLQKQHPIMAARHAVALVAEMAGGWNELIDITIEHKKMKILDLSFDLTSATFWVIFFGGAANNLISYSSDQAVIQRYLTTKDERAARAIKKF